MRCFVALLPPAPVREALEDFLEPRRQAQALRWTPSDTWHLTFAFAPQTSAARVDAWVEALDVKLPRTACPRLRLRGGGVFPDPDHAKVLYAAVDEETPGSLASLATGVRGVATSVGVRVEGGPYRPHLTLARSGRPANLVRWLRVLEAFSGDWFLGADVVLIESHLGQGPRGHPRYDVLHEWQLASPAAP